VESLAGAAASSFLEGMRIASFRSLSAGANSDSFAKEQVMANQQQDQNPRGEDRESSQRPVPGKSPGQMTGGQGNAKPGVQQRNPGSSGTKDDEQANATSDDRDAAGKPGGPRPTSGGRSGNDSRQDRK
jgi:hypothetical protein